MILEGEEAYISVELDGVIPGSIASGDYYCKFVHFYTPWTRLGPGVREPPPQHKGGGRPTGSPREGRGKAFRVQVSGVRVTV
jgi:hypothetical protein